MWLTRLAVNRPVFILMLVLAFVVIGLRARGGMKSELNPRVDFPFVTVTTTYPGAGAEEVETLITKPLEDAVGSSNNLKNITSRSQEGVSSIALEFDLGTDSNVAAAEVRQKVESAKRRLPRDVDSPIVEKLDFSAMPVLSLGMLGKKSLKELRYLADNVVKYRLGRVGGVGSISVGGGDVREIHVLVDKNRLSAYGLSINDVIQAMRTQNLNLPSGHITEGRKDYSVRVLGEFRSVEEIKNVKLFVPARVPGGVFSVYLRDIADVRDTVIEKTILTRINGMDSVGIVVLKLSDANTVDVVKGVQKELEGVKKELGDDVDFIVALDQSKLVEAALEDINMSLILGALLATFVVFLFLHNFRGTMICALSIPTSIIATFIPMYFFGFTMNQMTMLALSLVTGILVDDSIVEIENTFRHFAKGKTPREAALTARSEIGLAAITITLVDVVVFVPIAFMGGIVGRFFRQFGLTVAISTLFSLFMSFTFAPMLASRWYRYGENPEAEKKGIFGAFERFFHALDALYRSILAWVLKDEPVLVGMLRRGSGLRAGFEKIISGAFRRKLFVILIILFVLQRFHFLPAKPLMLIFLLCLLLFMLLSLLSSHRYLVLVTGILSLALTFTVFGKKLQFQFMPVVDQGQIILNIELPVGTAIEETNRITRQVEKIVSQIPEVQNVFVEVGRVSGGIRSFPESGTQYSQLQVELIDKKGFLDTLNPIAARKKKLRLRADSDVAAEIREKVKGIPGRITTVTVRGFGGAQPPVWIELYGQDLNKMEKIAKAIQGRLSKVEGIYGTDVSLRSGKPEIQIRLDRVKAASMGVDVQTVAMALRSSLEGNTDLKFRAQGDEVDIRVQLADVDMNDVGDVADVVVANVNGSPVRVRDIAEITFGSGPTKIDRKNRQRQVIISGNLMPGYALGNMQGKIEESISDIALGDVKLFWGGEAERMREEGKYMGSALGLSIILVYMLMAALFNSLLYPLIILLSLPMALIGAIAALAIRHETLSIISMIGFIMLVGLVMKNAILLVDYINVLRARGVDRDKAILEAGPTRLRPILMTTIAMVLAMLPIALRVGRASEQRAPLGVAVMGGLIVSTLLTLVMIPVIYTLFDDLTIKWSAWIGKLRKE